MPTPVSILSRRDDNYLNHQTSRKGSKLFFLSLYKFLNSTCFPEVEIIFSYTLPRHYSNDLIRNWISTSKEVQVGEKKKFDLTSKVGALSNFSES